MRDRSNSRPTSSIFQYQPVATDQNTEQNRLELPVGLSELSSQYYSQRLRKFRIAYMPRMQ